MVAQEPRLWDRPVRQPAGKKFIAKNTGTMPPGYRGSCRKVFPYTANFRRTSKPSEPRARSVSSIAPAGQPKRQDTSLCRIRQSRRTQSLITERANYSRRSLGFKSSSSICFMACRSSSGVSSERRFSPITRSMISGCLSGLPFDDCFISGCIRQAKM